MTNERDDRDTIGDVVAAVIVFALLGLMFVMLTP